MGVPAATTADWITAIGTVLAAAGTVGALIYAAKAAKSASKSAAAASAAVRNEALPLLLDVPYELYTDGEHEYPWPLEHETDTGKTPMRGEIRFDSATGTFAIPVRNVGRGVARIESFEISIAQTGEAYAQYGGQALPSGEEIWLAGRPVGESDFATALQRTPSPLHEYMIFVVTYTDNSGGQRQRFEMALGSRGRETAWRVLRTANTRLDDAPPSQEADHPGD